MLAVCACAPPWGGWSVALGGLGMVGLVFVEVDGGR